MKFLRVLFLFLFLIGVVGAECYDTDNGLNYYEAGSVRMHPQGWTDDKGYSEMVQGDRCVGDTISETYCNEAGEPARVEFVCPNGCIRNTRGYVCLRSFNEGDFKEVYSFGALS